MIEERNDIIAYMILVSILDVYESCDPPLSHPHTSLSSSIFQLSMKSLKSIQIIHIKYISECLMIND